MNEMGGQMGQYPRPPKRITSIGTESEYCKNYRAKIKRKEKRNKAELRQTTKAEGPNHKYPIKAETRGSWHGVGRVASLAPKRRRLASRTKAQKRCRFMVLTQTKHAVVGPPLYPVVGNARKAPISDEEPDRPRLNIEKSWWYGR
ncbi:hypothetical protein V6Z11_A04G096300 [Gossypium hirsutum]